MNAFMHTAGSSSGVCFKLGVIEFVAKDGKVLKCMSVDVLWMVRFTDAALERWVYRTFRQTLK